MKIPATFASLIVAFATIGASHPVVAQTADAAPSDDAGPDDAGAVDAASDDASGGDAGCVGAACAVATDPAFCDNDRYCVCCTGGTAGTSGIRPPYFWSYPGDCRAAGYIIRPELSKDLCFD
jgi:hypothetical protein